MNAQQPRALFLFVEAPETPVHNDNHERIAAAFAAAGWHVLLADHDSVRMVHGRIVAGRAAAAVDGFDLVWLVGFGHQRTFLDRMQMLSLVPATRFVNTPAALLARHGKFAWSEFAPETHASGNAVDLALVVDRGGDWILKPPAGSFGEGVVRVHRSMPGWRDLLAQRTAGGYALLQQYLPDAQTREKRVLVVNGRIIGAYRRLVGDSSGIAGNLAAGGRPVPTALLSAEHALIQAVVRTLPAAGVRFAGIDLAYPYVLEVNIANPGGLATLTDLYDGADPAAALVATFGGVGLR